MAQPYTDASSRSTLRALDRYMRAVNALPAGDARELALLTAPNVDRSWTQANQRAELLMRRAAQAASTISAEGTTATAPAADISRPGPTGHDIFATALEDALEGAHTALDVVQRKHQPRPSYAKLNPDAAPFRPPRSDWRSNMLSTKPQLSFDVLPDNSDAPFVPPHRAGVAPYGPDVAHPMEKAVVDALHREKAMAVPPPTLFTKLAEVDKDAWIDTPEALRSMAEQLAGAPAIAVDLEHHNVRSFMGFTCLLQISTRTRDWVVDTIKLRSHIHGALAPVFENPRVVKVFHGGNSDVVWLERDFGIYVINMFDTYLGAKAMGESAVALNDLQALYCEFVTSKVDKKAMQRSDWRRRPLTNKMLKYARSDTHFLLYIYDRLRQLLRDAKKLSKVLDESAEFARTRFVKPVCNVRKFEGQGLARGFTMRQVFLLRTLVTWRFEEARAQDEGLGYVMTNREIFELARHNPKSKKEVHAALDIREHRNLPQYIGANLDRLLDTLRKASEEEMDEEWIKKVKERQEKRLKAIEARRAAAKAKAAAAKEQGDAPPAAATDAANADEDDSDILSTSTSAGDTHERAKRRLLESLTSAACDSPSETDSMGSVVVGVLKKAAKNDGRPLSATVATSAGVASELESASDPPPAAAAVRPVVTAGKSVFDLSDSDVDDSTGVAVPVDVPKMTPTAAPRQSMEDDALEPMEDDGESAPVHAAEPTADDGESATDSGVHDAGTQQGAAEASAATFDLSESDDETDAAQLAEQVRRTIAAEAPVAKEMQLEATAAASQQVEVDDKPQPQTEVTEKNYKPLVEKKQKPRRRKKNKGGGEAPALQPFDYAAASKAEKKAKAAPRPKPFNPLGELKDTGRRVRRTRKNPGSGSRSMTFRGAPAEK